MSATSPRGAWEWDTSPPPSPGPSRQSSLRRRGNININNGTSPHAAEPLDAHPLSQSSMPLRSPSEIEDISRPNLKRLTSETERQVAENWSWSGGSERGSLDLLRMTPGQGQGQGDGGEVEVLIHTVGSTESLAGIALLYGIDLNTLRKTNKLWPSDPIHLRTHLYVPLEACRWTKSKNTFFRGPGEGQVTLTPKSTSRDKGKGVERDHGLQSSTINDGANGANGGTKTKAEGGWDSARTFMPSTNVTYDRTSLDLGVGSSPPLPVSDEQGQGAPAPRILDVVRIPSSQLRFFPRQKPPDSRSAIDSTASSYAIAQVQANMHTGGNIQNDLSTLPPPLRPPPSELQPLPKSKSHTVRIRPPGTTATPSLSGSTNALANKLSALFTIPPPPQPNGTAYSYPRSYTSTPDRHSFDSSRSNEGKGTGTSSPAKNRQAEVSLELTPRTSRETLRANGLGVGAGIGADAIGGHARRGSKKHD